MMGVMNKTVVSMIALFYFWNVFRIICSVRKNFECLSERIIGTYYHSCTQSLSAEKILRCSKLCNFEHFQIDHYFP